MVGQLLRRLGSQPQRRNDRRFDLEASRMSGQRRSEGRVGLQSVELAHPPSWTVGSHSLRCYCCWQALRREPYCYCSVLIR